MIAVAAMPTVVIAEVSKLSLTEMPLNQTPIEGVSSMISGAMDAEGVFRAADIMRPRLNGSFGASDFTIVTVRLVLRSRILA
ncbi:hypothetical protein [Yoonia sp. SDW83-1]|uniref:hypothetical protein n=1 Tax=Yoonia sp. SDW83-1 TaxID=3366945 RepID=UPI00398C4631